MSVVANQQRTFLRLLGALRSHWHTDSALPARIQSLLARNRQFGARDRRLYRELIYTAIRYLPWIEPLLDRERERAVRIVAWLAPDLRETSRFRSETCGDWPPSATLAERAAFLDVAPDAVLPGWFRAECPELFVSPELDSQVARAPLWLRIQSSDTSAVETEFSDRGWHWRQSDVLPSAWCMLDEADVTRTTAYRSGAIEIQDLGSQLVLESVGVVAGGRWLDGCAGAGGKTLQLARLLGKDGAVDAYDVRPAALDELAVRARRATAVGISSPPAGAGRLPSPHVETSGELEIRGNGGAATIRLRATAPPPGDIYDGVLVDSPCSGSGTWRRAPHLKWTTTPETIADRRRVQASLLAQYAPNVRRGGLLVYATCSVARSENQSVVTDFLATHPEFESAPLQHRFGFSGAPGELTILPARFSTDGFFVAALRRR
ncbi:MAG TPA: RsmB/NOP family class I SAM-dependent RNA methyltransferase [Opitutaceae bacterium]|nr:RsmB/NOP family class I SAM-dependent RNA methyltransferase [Opitutaceae bacterium]